MIRPEHESEKGFAKKSIPFFRCEKDPPVSILLVVLKTCTSTI